uniref:Photosystem II protein K n=2 Tax=Chromera velia TaxID=505693 RepID=D9IXJ7_9ALVE|nr:photosystem II protein K [Chromera velia]ADJ66525.1 photosystem II protein K [Chromera velia]
MFFSKLPLAFMWATPLVDTLPLIPVLFLLLAFLWQAMKGFP